MDVVRERLLAVDHNHGQTLAIAPLELGIASDVDLLELERDLGPHVVEHASRALAEVAALGEVEVDCVPRPATFAGL